MPNFQILSPDNFTIHPTDTYPSVEVAKQKFKEWKDSYKRQGYYSSVKYGRIKLEDLEEHCTLVELDE